MSVSVIGALWLVTAPAIADCGPQVHLLGTEPTLLAEVAGGLEARGVRAATNQDPGDTQWGCDELAVALERRGDHIVLSSVDPLGQPRVRSVRAPSSAVALVESWLIAGTELPAIAPRRLSLALRADAATGNDWAWTAGPAMTLSLALSSIFHVEATGRLGIGAMGVRFTELTHRRAPRVTAELLGGAAARIPLSSLSLWLGAAGGFRLLAGPSGKLDAVIAPLVGLTVPVDRSVDLEIRGSVQYLPNEVDQARGEWVFGMGVGASWGLL